MRAVRELDVWRDRSVGWLIGVRAVGVICSAYRFQGVGQGLSVEWAPGLSRASFFGVLRGVAFRAELRLVRRC